MPDLIPNFTPKNFGQGPDPHPSIWTMSKVMQIFSEELIYIYNSNGYKIKLYWIYYHIQLIFLYTFYQDGGQNVCIKYDQEGFISALIFCVDSFSIHQ